MAKEDKKQKEDKKKKEDKKEEKEKKEEKTTKKKKESDDKEKEEEEKEVEVPKKFKDIVKEIEEMSVLDLSELVEILEEKFGVSASAPVAAAPAAGGNGGEEEEEKSAYDVEVKEIGDKKIDVIKAVRDITGKGLKDAKNLVDSISDEPQVIAKSVPTDEAKEMKEKIEDAGATVELK